MTSAKNTRLRSACLGLAAATLLAVPAVTLAETVEVPVGQQGQDKAGMTKPRTGLKKEQVEAQFGRPLNTTTPVGDPPISSWEYPEYVVYFEHDHVIHTVLKQGQ